MNLASLLSVLPVVGPVIARAPEFVALFNQAKSVLHLSEQHEAEQALTAIQAENDARHERLQESAAAAAKK